MRHGDVKEEERATFSKGSRRKKGERKKRTSELKAIGMRREVAQLGLVGIA